MEKHWKAVISRSVCDYFFEAQNKATSPSDLPPVIATPHHYLISVYRCNIFFVAVCMSEGKKTKSSSSFSLGYIQKSISSCQFRRCS